MNKIKILLAEDDYNLGKILTSYLEAKGYDIVLCVNGQEAYQAYLDESFDICLIDVMMPVKDGFTLTKEIRKADKDISIIFLTAKSMHDDIIKGFSLGGDDFITKPFSMEVLLARIEAVLRRSKDAGDKPLISVYQIGKYKFDPLNQTLIIKENELKLTSKEAELLRLLCEHLNDVLDRTYALNKIWNNDSYFNARSMDVYITKLRKYLKEDSNIELLNVHGVGFKLIVNS